MSKRQQLGDVQGGGDPDPVQICRCHTHKRAPIGQRLYKLGNWRMTNKTDHLTGCPLLTSYVNNGGHVLASA